MYKSMTFEKNVQQCDRYHNQDTKHFIALKRELVFPFSF